MTYLRSRRGGRGPGHPRRQAFDPLTPPLGVGPVSGDGGAAPSTTPPVTATTTPAAAANDSSWRRRALSEASGPPGSASTYTSSLRWRGAHPVARSRSLATTQGCRRVGPALGRAGACRPAARSATSAAREARREVEATHRAGQLGQVVGREPPIGRDVERAVEPVACGRGRRRGQVVEVEELRRPGRRPRPAAPRPTTARRPATPRTRPPPSPSGAAPPPSPSRARPPVEGQALDLGPGRGVGQRRVGAQRRLLGERDGVVVPGAVDHGARHDHETGHPHRRGGVEQEAGGGHFVAGVGAGGQAVRAGGRRPAPGARRRRPRPAGPSGREVGRRLDPDQRHPPGRPGQPLRHPGASQGPTPHHHHGLAHPGHDARCHPERAASHAFPRGNAGATRLP